MVKFTYLCSLIKRQIRIWIKKHPYLFTYNCFLESILHDIFTLGGEAWAVAERERVVNRLLDGEVGVAARAVDVGDRVTTRTRDPCLTRGVVLIIELGIVESTGKETTSLGSIRVWKSLTVP